MRQMYLLLVVLAGLAGCVAGGQREDRASGIRQTKPPPPVLLEVKGGVLTWGRGRIVLGMTKPQVIEQIELSWQRPENDPFEGMNIPGIDRIKGSVAL